MDLVGGKYRLSVTYSFFRCIAMTGVCPAEHVVNSFVFIDSLLILWAFQLTLYPTNPLDVMGFMNEATSTVPPCAIEFETRIPDSELRSMMQHYPQIA